MIIPWVKIVWISDEKGYGLIATRPIPRGTVSFAQDGLDIVLPESQLEKMDPNLLEYIEKYSFEDFLGNRIISWDFGKYMNHDDAANTLSTGYGFEIAIRDIAEGEEVTDDYRIFSTHHDTNFGKNESSRLQPHPFSEEQLQQWNQSVQAALKDLGRVEQPLQKFVDPQIWAMAQEYSSDPNSYRCVSESFPLRYKLLTQNFSSQSFS